MDASLFPHLRILLGTILGLGMSKLLTGFAEQIQHPERFRPWLVHSLWAISVVIELPLFWWWEFALSRLPLWTFDTFFFLILYTITLYLMTAILFPEDIDEYGGYERYFMERRFWFFGLLAATFLFDMVDTAIKGSEHWHALSADYVVQVPAGLVLCAIGCWSRRPRVQLALALVHLGYQFYWIARVLATSDPILLGDAP